MADQCPQPPKQPMKLTTPERSKGGQNPPNQSLVRPPDPKGSGGTGKTAKKK